jgi:hypothetical protein
MMSGKDLPDVHLDFGREEKPSLPVGTDDVEKVELLPFV